MLARWLAEYEMYVCICQAVTEKQVRRAVERGVRDYAGLQNTLGVGSVCGRCRECACQVLDEAVESRDAGDDACAAGSLPASALV